MRDHRRSTPRRRRYDQFDSALTSVSAQHHHHLSKASILLEALAMTDPATSRVADSNLQAAEASSAGGYNA